MWHDLTHCWYYSALDCCFDSYLASETVAAAVQLMMQQKVEVEVVAAKTM